jgi:arylformamidase
MATRPVLTRDDVERGYNNRAAVPEHPYWLERFATQSREAIASLPVREIRYGSGPKETLDLFLPAAPAHGTLMFIHGGYWRMLDKADHSFVAPAFVRAGLAVAVINYDLCPDVTIATIVDQCRRAVAWVAREGPRHGAPTPLVIAGHSAGGHLAAMLIATDWRAHGFDRAPFAGCVSLSGVHDLEPLVLFAHNVDFRLDQATARDVSPVNHVPSVPVPLLIAVGEQETSEFVRQSQLLWDEWPDNRLPRDGGPMAIAGRHHFSVVLEFADPDSALTRATLALFPTPPGQGASA